MEQTPYLKLNKPTTGDYLVDDKLWKENPEKIDAIFEELAINVKTMGAKGDGVTNDYAIIQSALDIGKPVYLPYTASGYLINDTLTVGSGQIIYGANRNTKIIQQTNNIPIIRVSGSHYSVSNLYCVYQTQQSDTVSGGIGIELGDASTSAGAFEGTIENIVIEKAYRGIAIPTWSGNAYAFMNTLRQIRVLDAWDYSFYLNSTGIGLTTNTLVNCYALHQSGTATNPTAKGFYIGKHDDFTMINCACDHAMEDALTLENNFGGAVIDFHAEACRISKDYQAIVRVINSDVKFTNLQLPFNIINSGVNEGYFLWAYDNSNVELDIFVERDTANNGAGSYFSIVNDVTSSVRVRKFTSEFSAIFNGKKSVELNSYQASVIPTAGKWKKGDIAYNENPVSGGYIGWVCITGGDFATTTLPAFKAFGLIS